MAAVNKHAKRTGYSANFVSWDIKSMNHPVKRKKVLIHLKNLNADISFLQETHLCIADQHRLKNSWVGQTFHSNFNSEEDWISLLVKASLLLYQAFYLIPWAVILLLLANFMDSD